LGASASRIIGIICAIAAAAGVTGVLAGRSADAADAARNEGVHEGVASCAGSTCHSRTVSSGAHVRQNEIITWQGPGDAGAHSRAWRALGSERGQRIARRMGLRNAQSAEACLGCHADPAARRGEGFRLSDGVGCEACHGGSGGWLPTHYGMTGTHKANVAAGMKALDEPRVRAAVCLDCHFGGAERGQFVTHEMMAAGHPRVAFELDLFTQQQKHWDIDADYCGDGPQSRSKVCASGVRTWAVGQAMALERALTLYATPRGQNGTFPEFYFFDCHSCHRAISDDPKFRPTAEPNPGRPIPAGQPPFNDENMIMLSAAAKVAAPSLATRLEADSRAFHVALTKDRASAVQAAARLARTARELADAFDRRGFSRAETLAMLNGVLADEARRYTDYAGSAQAVMAADTLLSALVASGQADRAAAARVRPALNRAYAAVRDPTTYKPEAFRQALAEVAQAARGLR
jgi:hypothetical protein